MEHQTMSPDEYKAAVRSSWTEAEFTREVLALARRHGWRSFHARPGRTNKGWRTPVAGDGKGFFDLVLAKDLSVIFAELKTNVGRLSPEQAAWVEALRPLSEASENVLVAVWRPRDWETIERVLESG
jgi:hypothetical protein